MAVPHLRHQEHRYPSLVNELNGRGVAAPEGGTWCVGTVAAILKNRNYTGDQVWPCRNMGKYHTIVGDDIRERAPNARKVEFTSEALRFQKTDAHVGIVDRATFERVQKKLTQRKERCSSHKAKNGDCYL